MQIDRCKDFWKKMDYLTVWRNGTKNEKREDSAFCRLIHSPETGSHAFPALQSRTSSSPITGILANRGLGSLENCSDSHSKLEAVPIGTCLVLTPQEVPALVLPGSHLSSPAGLPQSCYRSYSWLVPGAFSLWCGGQPPRWPPVVLSPGLCPPAAPPICVAKGIWPHATSTGLSVT